MKKLNTTTSRVLAALRKAPHSSFALIRTADTTQPEYAIYQLRQMGYVIDTELRRTAEGKRYGRYTLMSEPKAQLEMDLS
jgi:hypothetical protein